MKRFKLNTPIVLIFFVTFFALILSINTYQEQLLALFDTKETADEKSITQKIKPLNYEGSMIIPELDTIDDIMTELGAEPSAGAGTFDLATMAQSITQEALKSFSDTEENSLPLIAHWNLGIPEYVKNMDPMYMMSRIELGEHILVSWKLDPYYQNNILFTYYEESIKKAAEVNLPLVFVLPAPESALTKDSYFFGLENNENANVITTNGSKLEQLSPFGPDALWREAGEQWANTQLMQQIQEWYPNPPLVIFVSEDEANKLSWSDVDNSSRYVNRYGTSKNDNFKRTLIGSQWIEKYRVMHEGFKDSFIKDAWKNNVKFVSYNSFSDNIGTSNEWVNNSTITNNYINIWPLTADGATLDFDLSGSKSDSTANAPHMIANNLPFMMKEAKSINKNFSFQLTINENAKIQDPAQYRGLAQFSLWFLRPSVIRQASSESEREYMDPMFQELADSVELIHYNDSLKDFWRNGELVANGESDLNKNIPEQYKNDPRWFLLDVDANPTRPWNEDTEVPVWAFAIQKGEAPNREWLVYVQSANGDMEDVTVSVPGYKDVMVGASVLGSFYSLSENSNSINTATANTATATLKSLDLIYPAITVLTKIETQNLNYPNYLAPYTDSIFNTKVTRITDSEVFGYENPRHDYSRVQTWNSDGSFIRIRNQLLDGNTYEIIKEIPWLNSMRWSHTDPLTVYGYTTDGWLKKQNIETEESTALGSFLGYDKISIGMGEGSLSLDDKLIVLTAKKDADLIVILFDTVNEKTISKKTYEGMYDLTDWVSISPSGKYIVFAWQPNDSSIYINDIYDIYQNFERRLDGKATHSDLCVNIHDDEVIVKFQYGTEGSDARGIWSYKLSDNTKKTQLLPSKYNGGHISCQNYKRPGWAYISTKQEGYRHVFSLELNEVVSEQGVVNNFAQHHSSSVVYRAEPHASPSPDGTKVIFASDWEGTQDISSYIVEPIN